MSYRGGNLGSTPARRKLPAPVSRAPEPERPWRPSVQDQIIEPTAAMDLDPGETRCRHPSAPA